MKRSALTYGLRTMTSLTALWMLAACAPTSHMTQVTPRHYALHTEQAAEEFDVADVTPDAQLSKMRGGFLFAGGLKIDFGLSTTTSINGAIQSSLNLSTDSLHGTLPATIQQLIQTGLGNSQTNSNSNTSNNSNTQSTTTVADNSNSNSNSNSNLNSNSQTPGGTSNTQVVTSSNTQGTTVQQTSTPMDLTTPTVSNVTNNVITIVQNTANNQLIQNQNVLNITVQNLHNYSNQINLASQRFPQVLSLH